MGGVLRLKRVVSLGTLAGFLGSGMLVSSLASAYQATTPAPMSLTEAEPIALITVRPDADGTLGLVVSQVTLRPQQSSLTLVATATITVLPQSGRLLLIANQSLASAQVAGDGTMGASLPELELGLAGDGTGDAGDQDGAFRDDQNLHYVEVYSGVGAVVEAGTTLRLVAQAGDPVQVLLISVAPGPLPVGR